METQLNEFTPSTIPADLLEKYNRSGPRYTSYPTAPQFSEEFDVTEVTERWREADRSRGLSVYVHLPFCAHRCLYCACTTEIGHSVETRQGYVEDLARELDRVVELLGTGREIHQLALGGGTPTHLTPPQMSRLVAELRSRFVFPSGGERSLEIDPRHVDEEYLDLLLELGFNRFSFGVQDFDSCVQQKIRRETDPVKLSGLLEHTRRRGQSAINLDIMYGLPGQTEESFSRTIDKTLDLRPTRAAVFGYAHVPWVSPHQKALEKHQIPGPELRAALFGMAYDKLTDAGYVHVGMDHFALPEDELVKALRGYTLTRNFMGYTTRGGRDLVGVGASAISSVNTTYTQNLKTVADYRGRVSDPWFKALLMSQEDVLRRELILQLFCNFRVDLKSLGERHGLDWGVHFSDELGALQGFREDEMLDVTNGVLEVTDLGRFFIRNICMTFDQYLAPGKGRYSKTV
jgi:oxygen-independent coproporphyrinogen-3 oxidase